MGWNYREPHFLTQAPAVLIGCILMVLLRPISTCAQDGAIPYALSLEQSFEIALKNRPEMHAAEAQIAAERYGLESAKKVNYPVFDIEARPALIGTTESADDQEKFAPGRIRFELDQPLYTGGLNTGLISNAQSTVDLSQARKEQEELELKMQVASEYYNALYYQKLAELYRHFVQEGGEQLERVSGFYETGSLSRIDVLEANQYVERQRRDARQMEGNLESARRQLRLSLHLPDQDLQLVDDVEAGLPPALPAFEDFLFPAQQRNPELRQLEVRNNLLEDQIKIQEARMKPQVAAYASYIPQQVFLDRRDDAFEARDVYEVGLKIDWQILDWGLNSYQAKRLRALQNENQFNQQALALDLRKRIQNIYNRLQTLQQLQPLLQAEEQNNAEKLGLARERYYGGRSSYVEVNQSLRDYQEVRASLIQNQIDMRRLWVELSLLAGNIPRI